MISVSFDTVKHIDNHCNTDPAAPIACRKLTTAYSVQCGNVSSYLSPEQFARLTEKIMALAAPEPETAEA